MIFSRKKHFKRIEKKEALALKELDKTIKLTKAVNRELAKNNITIRFKKAMGN